MDRGLRRMNGQRAATLAAFCPQPAPDLQSVICVGCDFGFRAFRCWWRALFDEALNIVEPQFFRVDRF